MYAEVEKAGAFQVTLQKIYIKNYFISKYNKNEKFYLNIILKNLKHYLHDLLMNIFISNFYTHSQ